jgi:hypothetical protein
MSVSDVLASLGRRWLLVSLCLALTAVGVVLASDVQPVYRATQVFVLQPPQTADAPNQLKGIYPSLAITGHAIGERLSTPAARAHYREAGVTGDYAFIPRNTGTVQTPSYQISSMMVTATGVDETSALRSLALLSADFHRELGAMQDEWDVAPSWRITTTTLVPPSAVALPNSRKRAVLGTALLGTIVSLVIPVWFDRSVARRRGRALVPLSA